MAILFKPHKSGNGEKIKQYTGIALGFSVIALFYYLSLFVQQDGLSAEGVRAFSILLFAIILWSTEALSAPVTAIAILALIPFLGVLPYDEAFIGLGASLIWRLMSILLITSAIQQTGLHKRLALVLLSFTGGSIKKIYLSLILMSYFFVFIIPVPIGRVTLMTAICSGLLSSLEIRSPHNLGKLFFIGISIIGLVASSTLIVGASAMIYSVALFETIAGYQWTYLSWFITNFPITFTTTLVICFVLYKLFPFNEREISSGSEYITEQIKSMGEVSLAEKKIFILYLLMLISWLTGLADNGPVEMAIALMLFMPGISILKWKDVSRKLSWGTLLLFGSSLSLARGLQNTGFIGWVVDLLSPFFYVFTPITLAMIVIVLTIIIRLGMSNMTGVVAALLPLVLTMAMDVGLNPVWIGMICVIASSFAFFLPTQSPSHLTTYALGYYTIGDFIKAGTVSMLIFIICVLLGVTFYWPLIGLYPI